MVSRMAQQLIWTLQFHGLMGTIFGGFGRGLRLFGKRSALEIWCVEYKESCFDRRFHVDTAAPVEVEQLDIPDGSKRVAVEYMPISLLHFLTVMSSLRIHHRDYVFIDFGSGKGRALLLASEFAFKLIVGVEISPSLHKIAEKNLTSYSREQRRCDAITLICADATEFQIPDEPLVIFLYNPFHASILETVLPNLHRSLEAHPRHVVVVYSNPRQRWLLDQAPFLTPMPGLGGACALYEFRPA